MLRDEGIAVHLGAKILGVRGRSGQTVSLQLQTPSGDQTIEGSDILVATGRTPNTAGIGLELASVSLDARGYVAVNDRLEPSAPEVWAVVQTEMLAGMPYTGLRDAILAHPTMAEGLGGLFSNVPAR